jgi:hypothetical protein
MFSLSICRILPEHLGYILSHPETKERVQSYSDASDVLRYAFTLTEDTIDHQYEVHTFSRCHLSDAIIEVLIQTYLPITLVNFIFCERFVVRNLQGVIFSIKKSIVVVLSTIVFLLGVTIHDTVYVIADPMS